MAGMRKKKQVIKERIQVHEKETRWVSTFNYLSMDRFKNPVDSKRPIKDGPCLM